MPDPKIFNDIDPDLYKGVLLDLDNTVYEYEPCNQLAKKSLVRYLVNNCNVPIKESEWLELYDISRSYVKKNLLGFASSHSRLLYIQNMIERALGATNVALSLGAEKVYWDTFIDQAEIFPEAIDFMKRCKTSSTPICILTDLTSAIQFQKIQSWDLSSSIDFVVSSEECGQEKPHPFMFFTALKKLDIGPESAIMIGDSQKKDLDGAINMGIKAIKI